ncbi:type III-B CRISPR module-associated Cmr3 family protein [Sorangium sp. So ce1024]|uniref:type III-B CRISPR module-associated Cmr3 family protein n=1 Tax=Sorangium sp. So ce1024 TaxID=3133327 RepID=UPI003F077531
MTNRITLFFEPLDVLHFRDHRPFDAGMHHVASTVFPRPTVFRGAVRTALFRALGARFEAEDPFFDVPHAWARDWLGGRDTPGSLALRGPLLAQSSGDRVAPLFHPPHDLAWPPRGAAAGTAHLLAPRKPGADLAPRRFRWNPSAVEQVSSELAWTGRDIGKDSVDDFFTEAGASVYLAAGAGSVDLSGEPSRPLRVAKKEVLQSEVRVGIARDPEQLAASDGMLYMTTPFRLAPDAGFAVDIALPGDASDAARALVRQLDGRRATLGGKGHGARIRILDGPLPLLVDPLDAPAARPLRCKLWLQTPLPLKQPLPPGLMLVAKRSEPVGGFDLQTGAPRELRAALPAGAVVHFTGSLSDLATDADLRTGYGTALLVSPSHGVIS